MKHNLKIFIFSILSLCALALIFWFAITYIGTHDIAVLNPKGMIGIKERNVIVTVFLLMLIVVIPVFILTALFAWRYRASNRKAKYTPDWENKPLAEVLWWGIPLIIIVILASIVWKTSFELSPFKPIENGKKPIEIQVVALDWKWLFIYPEQGVASVNFVQFPEKTPLSFAITADAPMNSFWIPQLGGQIYAMPAMRSKLHLIANEKGSFRGRSANISGKGFAGMSFTAKATSQEDFDQWVEDVKRSRSPLGFEEYLKLVKPSENNPVTFYLLKQKDLFEQIINQYNPPSK